MAENRYDKSCSLDGNCYQRKGQALESVRNKDQTSVM